MLKKAVMAGTIFTATIATGGELVIGGGEMKGHSDKLGECINDGHYLEAGYNHEVFKLSPLGDWASVSLDVGGQVNTYRYETAKREYRGGKEYGQRDRYSTQFNAVLKPQITLWRLTMYYIYGGGVDHSQPDGYALGYFTGEGVEIQLTDRVSVGYMEKRYERHGDTGYYMHRGGDHWYSNRVFHINVKF